MHNFSKVKHQTAVEKRGLLTGTPDVPLWLVLCQLAVGSFAKKGDQIVNICSFTGEMVSLVAIGLCFCGGKAAIDGMAMNECACILLKADTSGAILQ